MRRTLIALAVAAVLGSTALAVPAEAAYRDPLTRGDHVTYNRADYRLSIAPVSGAATVTRFGHRVPATYTVRMIKPGKRSDTVVFSERLGYWRAAYLRTKTVSLDLVRDYSMKTYLKKVTSFSAAYAHQRVLAHTVEYRHRTLRGDVAITVSNAGGWVEDHDSSQGIDEANIVLKSDGFFGYDRVRIDVIPDARGTGSTTEYVVYGYDPADGYSVMYDSQAGTTTGYSDDPRGLLK
jgi:hypothetical protein